MRPPVVRGRADAPGSRRRSFQTSCTVCQSIGTATGPGSVATGTQVVEARPRRSGRRRRRARPARRARARAPARTRTPAARSRPPSGRSGAGATAVPVASWSRSPASVAISGSSACVAAEVQSSTRSRARKAPMQVAPALLERALRSRVVARGAAHLRGEPGLAARARGRRRPRRGSARAPRAGSAGSARPARRASPRAGRRAPGVSPTVTGAPSSRSSSGRYTHATASQSHSSPNGQVPKPSTYGMCECSTSASAPAAPRRAAHAGTGLGQRPAFSGASRQPRITSTPIRMAGQRRDREHGDGVEGGVDGDHGEQRAGALVDQALSHAEDRDDRQDDRACRCPGSGATPNTSPSISAADQTRQPRAQRPVEERAEEDLLGHRRHDDHRDGRPRTRRRGRPRRARPRWSRRPRTARCSRTRRPSSRAKASSDPARRSARSRVARMPKCQRPRPALDRREQHRGEHQQRRPGRAAARAAPRRPARPEIP